MSIKLENVHVLGVVLLHQPPVQQNINLFVLKLNPTEKIIEIIVCYVWKSLSSLE